MPISHSTAADDEVILATRKWLELAVIGLNLCPFAKAVHVKNQIRYRHSTAQDTESLRQELEDELRLLSTTDPMLIDTTVLIHPHVLCDFLDYNDFLDVADQVLIDLDLEGIIQIASFHPHYQFAGTMPNDVSNNSNRSPFPILHLLREASIERAVEAIPDAEDIFERNIETLKRIGKKGWKALQHEWEPAANVNRDNKTD
jgi:hypothetical protein